MKTYRIDESKVIEQYRGEVYNTLVRAGTIDLIAIEKGIVLCEKYLDHDIQDCCEKFHNVLNGLKIHAEFSGIVKQSAKEIYSLDYSITISNLKNGKNISFIFHFSHNDVFKIAYGLHKHKNDGEFIMEFKNSMLYSVLCSVKCEYDISESFENFCSDFGYNPDSKKDFALWEMCLKHSKELKKVFNPEDIQYLPS